MPGLIDSLLARGDYVAIEQGRLVITPSSGKPVPADWLRRNEAGLVKEIAAAFPGNVFQYQGYSTGRYGAHKAPGVLLKYIDVENGQVGGVIFNAELTRERSTKSGKAGDNLPKGQFRVSANYAFPRYWIKLGLTLPRRLSEFHECMGKLKAVYVTAATDSKGDIEKATLAPLTIPFDSLKGIFKIGKSSGKEPATFRQGTGKEPASATGKEIAPAQVNSSLQSNPSACTKKYELSEQVSANNVLSNTTIETPISSHISDWMARLESEHARRKHGH